MILKFEEWWHDIGFKLRPQHRADLMAEAGWHARDAEIADLKRQLVERDAKAELVNRLAVELANTKLKLDDYVQEQVDRAVLAESEWWLTQMTLRGHHFDLWAAEAERLAANRAKVNSKETK